MVPKWLKRFWEWFLQLNIFKTHTSNEQTAFQELLATRIYVISIITLLLTAGISVTFRGQTENIVEYSPSISRFSYFAKVYPNTIKCRCSKIAIAYETFVNIKADFHQVCSSEFITQKWIDSIFVQDTIKDPDIRSYLPFFWQIIAGFCVASNSTWALALGKFNESYAFTEVAITEDILRIRVEEH